MSGERRPLTPAMDMNKRLEFDTAGEGVNDRLWVYQEAVDKARSPTPGHSGYKWGLP